MKFLSASNDSAKHTALGPDGLKHHAADDQPIHCLLSPLTNLFNHSLCTGIVPDDWKQSYNSFFKSNDTSSATNYCPISLLSLVSKDSSAIKFFDLSKAFDSLPYHLILSSLTKVGVCGNLLSWVQSYLSDQTQRVVFSGTSSSSASVTSGVPQGSIFGPLLFIISIDSLASFSLSSHASLIITCL